MKRIAKDKAAEEIKRLWGDLDVVDAKNDLRVIILPEDVEKATRKDPGCCVFAQACKRTFGASKVLFFRSVAYVELPDENGNRHVERFQMPPTMRSLIEDFDRGKEVIPKAGFLLKAPTKGRTLEHRRLEDFKRYRNARLEGTMVKSGTGQGVGRYRDKPIVVELAVRNGAGMVHFTTKPVSES